MSRPLSDANISICLSPLSEAGPKYLCEYIFSIKLCQKNVININTPQERWSICEGMKLLGDASADQILPGSGKLHRHVLHGLGSCSINKFFCLYNINLWILKPKKCTCATCSASTPFSSQSWQPPYPLTWRCCWEPYEYFLNYFFVV